MRDPKNIPLIKACVSMVLAFSILIGVVFFFLSNYSLGWFSKNTDVSGTGMSVRSQTTFLIISDDASDIISADASAINGGSPFSLTLSQPANNFSPATHDSTYATYPTGLKYIPDVTAVGYHSGVTVSAPTFANAANGEHGRTFYADFTVYIARFGSPLNNATLTVSLSATKDVEGTPTAVTSGSFMATSVDFYRGSVAQGNYVGTLNVAGYDAAANDYTTRKPSLYLLGSANTTGTIPLNTAAAGDKYLTFVLRCYFDGALLSGEDQAYINTATLDDSVVTLHLAFEATGD